MGLEIERKFLVTDTDYHQRAEKQVRIRQGYLSRDPERTVRVRIKDDKGYLTVKGSTDGCVRQEFEYEIPQADAESMLALCVPPVLEKIRYLVREGNHVWEIDEFLSLPAPLTLAEIELESVDEPFDLPSFIGEEVTGDPVYYNSNLTAGS
ncbi:MAG: CYTH domain-containing protein [Muribaculaceae bacterium]|nr:CYTH domain-containing protein [Muribaculaceae bacterium]